MKPLNNPGINSPKLRQEPQITFKEQAKIINAITQHGQTFYPGTKGKTHVIRRKETVDDLNAMEEMPAYLKSFKL